MKKIVYFLLFICFLGKINSKFQMNMKEKIKDTSFTRQDLQTVWSSFFTKTQESSCSATNTKYNLRKIKKRRGNKLPTKKANKWDKKYGYGLAAYFFDYIDTVFQKEITSEFKLLYEKVKNIELAPESEYSDPYSIDKIILRLTKKRVPKSCDYNNPLLLAKLKEISEINNSSFDEKSYANSITAPMIYAAVKQFQWKYDSTLNDWPKNIVDTYDFDGDGRLNPREFILMTIINNKNILGGFCKYCYNDILRKLIDPIFFFIDCNNDGLITSEDMWHQFMELKRPDFKKYNIYKCVINGKKYRTSAMNDFILKNMKTYEGYVNKQEFQLGILLGYWDRQIDSQKVFCDDCQSMKNSRWDIKGNVDKVCLRILNNNDHEFGK